MALNIQTKSAAVAIDIDPPLLSHHGLCLKKSKLCPTCCLKLWQCFESLRWKATTNKCVLRTYKIPLVKNKYVTLIEILVLLCFIISEIISFAIELSELEFTAATTTQESMRIFGLVCAKQSLIFFALTFTLATRNTFWYFLVGIPFERALFYHIWLGRYAILLIWLHFVCFLFYWNDLNVINENISIATNISGLMSLICLTFLFIFSLSYVRRNHWELFLKTHWIFFLIFLYFGIKHDPYFWFESVWIKFGIIVWSFDIIYRIYISLIDPLLFSDSRLKCLNLQSLTDDIIKITLQKNTFKSVEGQYCFLCIPAINITEWHPFSISNCYPDSNGQMIVEFHIKILGDWTRKLKELTNFNNNNKMLVNWNDLKVFMEGPYGKTELKVESYNSIILVAGGIGITPLQNIFANLMHYIQNNNITVIKRIHFLWMIRNPNLETMKEFNRIHWQSVKQMIDKNGFEETIKINQTEIISHYFVTRVKDENKIKKFKEVFKSGIHFNRPKMDEVINEAKKKGKTALFACGPMVMINDVKKRSINLGIDCHTEKFFF